MATRADASGTGPDIQPLAALDEALSSVRNPGTALDLEWLERVHVNRSAAERRAATLPARRSVKKQWQAAWLLRAVSCIDLTTLSGDDTPDRVRRLCAKARRPLREDLELQLLLRHGLGQIGPEDPGRPDDGRFQRVDERIAVRPVLG